MRHDVTKCTHCKLLDSVLLFSCLPRQKKKKQVTSIDDDVVVVAALMFDVARIALDSLARNTCKFSLCLRILYDRVVFFRLPPQHPTIIHFKCDRF